MRRVRFSRQAKHAAAYAFLGMTFMAPAYGETEATLYSFGQYHGELPRGGLIAVRGRLFGTTASNKKYGPGVFFRFTTKDRIKVLHSFATNSGGQGLFGGLVHLKNLFYGAAAQGGASDKGLVFALTDEGAETVVYNFKGGADGANPEAAPILLNGVLYGTTAYGGAYKHGTVFALTPDGQETILHSFGAGKDGSDPAETGLVSVKGTIYGLTSAGGAHKDGTVYSITPAGDETVLHSFSGGADGKTPGGVLVTDGHTLYGITYAGGGSQGVGVIYSMSLSGKESVVYTPDTTTAYPVLTYTGGTLYGTGGQGCGTVYSLTPSGTLSIIHSFTCGKDGSIPFSPLLNYNGILYGTTFEGGVYGHGTIYTISP